MRRSWSVRCLSRSSSLCLIPQPVEHLRGQLRVQQRLAGRHAANGVDEVDAADLLQQVARRAGHDRIEERLVIGERREDQALDLRVGRSDLAAHLDPVAVGQLDVEHGDVGAGGRDASEASSAVPASPTTSMSPLGLEQVPQAAAHDLVVVEEEHTDHVGHLTTIRSIGRPPPRQIIAALLAGDRSRPRPRRTSGRPLDWSPRPSRIVRTRNRGQGPPRRCGSRRASRVARPDGRSGRADRGRRSIVQMRAGKRRTMASLRQMVPSPTVLPACIRARPIMTTA